MSVLARESKGQPMATSQENAAFARHTVFASVPIPLRYPQTTFSSRFLRPADRFGAIKARRQGMGIVFRTGRRDQ